MRNLYKLIVVLGFLLAVPFYCLFAQVGINADHSSPNSSAMLDVSSTSKGLLPPRMLCSEKNAIASPPAGLMIWCINCGPSGEMQVYNGTTWTNLIGGAASGLPGAPTIGTATAGHEFALVPFTAPVFDGGLPIVYYTATSSPGGFTGTLNQAGSGTITVAGLTNGTSYTFTVTAHNNTGTGAASAASNSVTPEAFAIGQTYGGGIIFYLDGTGRHGLISATTNQSAGIVWAVPAYQNISVPGGTSAAIGSGSTNTDKIIAQNGAGITYAAGLARAYTGGGNNDWFLPSKDELNLMYAQKIAIGGFVSTFYWNSCEYNATNAWAQNFTSGTTAQGGKVTTAYVRAIRAF